MSDKPANPAAFPKPGWGNYQSGEQDGMELRDYFAGQAITGVLKSAVEGKVFDPPDTIAQWAYQVADAMLAERDK